MAKNLDHEFDEYLKSNEPAVLKALPQFLKKLDDSTFKYGKVTIPTFFKPLLITPKQDQILKRASKLFSQIINTATRLYFEEGHVSHVFRLSPQAAELVQIDPGYSESVVFARFDGMLEGESFKILDFNCDSPAGAAYADEIEQAMREEPLINDFLEKYHISQANRCEDVLNALLETYEEFGGYENPTIAIIDWKTVRTKPEFEYLKKHFESRGYKTVIADPRDMKYKGGKLYYKSTHISLILRRVVFDELVNRIDDVEDFLKAYRDKAVCVVNPLRSRLASAKALFSILTDPQYDHYFTETENNAKRDFLPWTRRIVDAENFYGHRKDYLINFMKDEKDSIVLKPSSSYGGTDVMIGCESPDADWNEAIDKALKSDWVIQGQVNIPILTVPKEINGKVDFDYKKYNYNALIAGGRYAGGFSRLSSESVVNVARGGGLIPSVVSERVSER